MRTLAGDDVGAGPLERELAERIASGDICQQYDMSEKHVPAT